MKNDRLSYLDKYLSEFGDLSDTILDFQSILGGDLARVGEANPFVEAIVFCDESGLVLAHYSGWRKSNSNFLEDVLGPASAILVATAKKIAQTSTIVNLNAVMIEGVGGGIIASLVKTNYILSFLYKKGAPKGLIARDFVGLKNRIEGVLNSYGI